MDGIGGLAFQFQDRPVVLVEVLGGDLAVFIGLGGQLMAVVEVVGDLGFLALVIRYFFDPFPKAVVGVFGYQGLAFRVLGIDPVESDRSLMGVVLIAALTDLFGAACWVVVVGLVFSVFLTSCISPMR